jgi:hypothetical protein
LWKPIYFGEFFAEGDAKLFCQFKFCFHVLHVEWVARDHA